MIAETVRIVVPSDYGAFVDAVLSQAVDRIRRHVTEDTVPAFARGEPSSPASIEVEYFIAPAEGKVEALYAVTLRANTYRRT